MAGRFDAIRYHDFSAGHRVVGHENKCAYLHGHNYRAWFYCAASLDSVGRVIDFSVIEQKLCQWLEINWDHRFLIWKDDPLKQSLLSISRDSVAIVPFNPTAENIAQYLVDVIGSTVLADTGVTLRRVLLEETRKCSAAYELSD